MKLNGLGGAAINKTVNQFVKTLAKDHPVLAGAMVVALMVGNWVWERWQYKLVPEGECLIKKVYDGDTMTLNCGGTENKVRLYCIDAPEMRQTPWGELARNNLETLAGQSVRLKQIDKDRYGRVVGEVWRGETNLNLQQVRDGMAAVYAQYCKDAIYPQTELLAQGEKLGIWKTPGLHQAPWDWRK
ncbi:micrococcal nuclease [Gammaproteobacteria bacterium]